MVLMISLKPNRRRKNEKDNSNNVYFAYAID